MKRTLIFVFPGTNCETETFTWITKNLETYVEYFDESKHKKLTVNDIHALIIPGGFSFGDYLRAGAIAARSFAMDFVKNMASQNVPILGICNGFQILCESGLLSGALTKNITQQHHHFPVELRINETFFHEKNCVWIPKISNKKIQSLFTKIYESFELPMSCGTGRYVCVESNSKYAALFYSNNENGSAASIAGITNAQGNILGLMPHPERASSKFVGSTYGLLFLFGLSLNKNISIKPNSELAEFINSHITKKSPAVLISANTNEEIRI